MTFKDIFKSDFMETINAFSLVDAIIALALALVIGMFIFVIYRKTYSGVMYNSGFGVSLVALTMITSFVILAVTSNVVLSLGMVGALSIVRFRTAIKEAMDIVFLFWAIAAGIVLGAGLIPLAVIGSVIIGIVVAVISNIKYKQTPYILVVRTQHPVTEAKITGLVRKKTKKYLLKSKSTNGVVTEITYEVRIDDDNVGIVDDILGIDDVENVALVSYNGEYMS